MSNQTENLKGGCNRPEGTSQNTLHRKNIKLTPRLQRLGKAFLAIPGGLSREQVDRVTPCSNGPHYVALLAKRIGARIICDHVRFTTIDGDPSWHGHYRLTPEARQRLIAALE